MVNQNSQNETIGKGSDGNRLEGKAAEVKAALDLVYPEVRSMAEKIAEGIAGENLAESTNKVIREKLPKDDSKVIDVLTRWKVLGTKVTAKIQENEPEETKASRTRVVNNFVKKMRKQILPVDSDEGSKLG